MKNKIILSTLFLALFLSSCARAPVRTASTIPGSMEPQPVPEKITAVCPEVFRQDVIHEVGPGETVWQRWGVGDSPAPP